MASRDAATEIADELIASRRSLYGAIPDDMPRWMAATIGAIDTINLWVGRIVAWLVLPLTLAMVYEISARYLFRAPTIWAYDISRMLYGAYFMIGAGYALSKGVHLRADFLYRRFPVRVQGWIDVVLYLFLYFPALIVFFSLAYGYAETAIVRGERGMDTAWMPLLGPIKAALPLGVFLLLIQGVAELLKSLYAATRGRWPQA